MHRLRPWGQQLSWQPRRGGSYLFGRISRRAGDPSFRLEVGHKDQIAGVEHGRRRKESQRIGQITSGVESFVPCKLIEQYRAIDTPTFQAASPDPASWIKPSGALLTFHTVGQMRDGTPIFDKRYSVYSTVS